MSLALTDIVHPYPRYGLAVALSRRPMRAVDITDGELRMLLVEAIESGLSHFRMRTEDDPAVAAELKYVPIKIHELEVNPTLVQSSGLAGRGLFLYPSIVTTDGEAKGTYDNAVSIRQQLLDKRELSSPVDLSRSFAPTTAKINNGRRSQSPPRGTLLEAATSVITTLTPHKPAAWIGDGNTFRNTAIIPDLDLDDLCDFVELFQRMWTSDVDGNLLVAKVRREETEGAAPAGPKRRQVSTTKSEYRRPRLYNGNYPFAPQRDAAAFGPVGLLGAIGRWAHRANETPWADGVLLAIAERPLYIVSYDSISQVQFDHHVVNLARSDKLCDIVSGLTYDSRLSVEIEDDRPRWSDPKRQLFHLSASRFLQLFTESAFCDFFAVRSQYPPVVRNLFEVYFMEKHDIDPAIVSAAGTFGQWLNSVAFRAAKDDVENNPKIAVERRDAEIRKEKARVIVGFESTAMSARTSPAMLAQVITQAGRLGQGAAPAVAKPFIDAAMTGGLSPDDARHLLMVYMRLRPAANAPKNVDTNSPYENR